MELTHSHFRKQYESIRGTFYEYGLYRILEPSRNDARWLIYHGDVRLGAASDYLEAIEKINSWRKRQQTPSTDSPSKTRSSRCHEQRSAGQVR